MSVSYLFSIYPNSVQAAMRREIEALEGLGLTIDRYTLRASTQALVDEADLAEKARTRVVHDAGALGLLRATAHAAATRPAAFWKALRLAIATGYGSERGLIKTLIYFVEACLLLRWMEERGTRHLHAHYATNSATVAMLCRALGGPPYSFTMHGPEEFDAPRGYSLREKIRHARFVVAITEYTRSQLYRWADYADWPKIHVVHCGVSPMFLDVGPTPVPAARRLVNVGRIAEQKGQMLLIEATARLAAEGLDPEVVIVGDGPLRGEAERLIDRLGVRGRVRITGFLSNRDVLRTMQESRALVLPSFAEGLPGVFFEALALGRPVLTTYIAGNPELIEPGACGWLVPAGSVDALVDAMRAALTAPTAELERMGREGARRVAERHDARIEAARLAALFDGADTPRPAPPSSARRPPPRPIPGRSTAGSPPRRPPSTPEADPG